MRIKVKIVKNQKYLNLRKGDITYALAVESEKVGVFEEAQKRDEKFMDEDDDDYIDRIEDMPKEKYVGVKTYLLVVDRKGHFVWIEAEIARCCDEKWKCSVQQRIVRKSKRESEKAEHVQPTRVRKRRTE